MHCPLTVHALSTHCPRTVHEYCPRTVHEYYTQTTHVLHACTNVGAAIPSIGSVIDLIMVFAAFLVGRQTILVSFFSRERRNRKETNGWKNISATGRYRYTSHVFSVKLFAQYLRMQLKNDFFLHLFNIGWPCKHYNFQMCSRDNLVSRMMEMAFQSFQISKLSRGACPRPH